MLTAAKLILRMRRAGIVNPVWTYQAAKKAHLPLALACAFLDQETGGGHNVFGHDPTIYVGWGQVTKAKYLAYKVRRGRAGRGGMQGIGPMQLTYWAYQDQADKVGGCWKPRCNMRVGFGIAAEHIRRYGLHAGIAAYNGNGTAAEHYADSVLARQKVWAKRLGL